MLTGDAPKSIEDYLVSMHGDKLESEVLKLGHHGSKTSTSELFLSKVSPHFAVVSTAAGNSYGHPHEEVMDLVREKTTEVFSTAEFGSVTFLSDGQTVWRKD